MSDARRSQRYRLLGWYPPAWRERYGEEFCALMEDTLGDRPAGPRLALSVAWAGLRERGHAAGVIGDSVSTAERARAGSLLVLCAWAVFVVAGSSFAKLAEGFRRSVPAPSVAIANDAYRSIVVLCIVGAALVLAGATIALPAFGRGLRGGGWPSVRAHVLRAGAATVASVAAMIGLRALARTLTPAQRNGTLSYHPVALHYLMPFMATALLLVVTLALWTSAAVVAARSLELPRRVLSAEAALAVVLSAVMVAMTAATALWWATIASSAPWFLQGTRAGSPGSPFTTQMVGTMALMVVAMVLAAGGVSRMAPIARRTVP